MPIDPRLNCAAEICCTPEQAHAAAVSLLCDCGVSEDEAPRIAKRLREKGIVFTSSELADAIRHIAFPEVKGGDGKL
jgi:hypothetical protein